MTPAQVRRPSARRKAAAPETPRYRVPLASWAWPALIVAVTVAVYANTFAVPFLFDDIGSIVENPRIKSLWNVSQLLHPVPEQTVSGRPLLQLSFGLNFAISGLHVWSYHLLNILIHAFAALALMGVVRRTLETPAMQRFAPDAGLLAFVTSLIWAVHPLQTESVTYVVQRAESLAGLFYFLTLYCAIRSHGDRKTTWIVASTLCCAAGMGSKEIVATVPLAVFLHDWCFRKQSLRELLKSRWPLYAALCSCWIVLGLVAFGARTGSAGFGFAELTPTQYAITQLGIIPHYLRLCIWPRPLVFDYFWPVAQGLAQVAGSAIFVVLLVVCSLWALATRRPLGFVGGFVFLTLAPTSSIVPIVTEVAAEHRMYLALAAISAALAIGGWSACRGNKRTYVAAVAAVALLLGWTTMTRNLDYRTGTTIWRDTVAKRPANPRAFYNLGRAFDDESNPPEAIKCYAKALALKPDYRDARMNLGSARLATGDAPGAIAEFDCVIAKWPSFANAYLNMGIARTRQSDTAGAVAAYKKALSLDPRNAQAHYSYGNLLAEGRKTSQAEAEYREAVAIDPSFAPAHLNLGNLLGAKGDDAGALAAFQNAVSAAPGYPRARMALAIALARQGRKPEAEQQLIQALRLNPQFTDAARMLESLRTQ